MDKKLLEILGCPLDKSELEYNAGMLICKACGRRYQLLNGVPEMLVADYSAGDEVYSDR